MTDWRYLLQPNHWFHPESRVVIRDEDMPEELKP